MSDNQPLACDLTAIADEEREMHKENAEMIFGSVEVWKEQPDGYAFRIPTDTQMVEKAGSFIARERQCCPFFTFTLKVTPDGGPVWLKLTGDKEVKQYVRQNVIPQLELSEDRSLELPDNTAK